MIYAGGVRRRDDEARHISTAEILTTEQACYKGTLGTGNRYKYMEITLMERVRLLKVKEKRLKGITAIVPI